MDQVVDATESLQNLSAMFSDMYKDVYGHRPRFTAGWTAADYERELADLDISLQAVMAEEKAREARAAAKFEATVTQLINSGAGNRATAIRWLHDAEDTNGDDGYLEHCMGLPYGYLKENA